MTSSAQSPQSPQFLTTLKQYLTAPGEGVFTVHTGSERRNSLQSKLFGADAVSEKRVRAMWEQGLDVDCDCMVFMASII